MVAINVFIKFWFVTFYQKHADRCNLNLWFSFKKIVTGVMTLQQNVVKDS